MKATRVIATYMIIDPRYPVAASLEPVGTIPVTTVVATRKAIAFNTTHSTNCARCATVAFHLCPRRNGSRLDSRRMSTVAKVHTAPLSTPTTIAPGPEYTAEPGSGWLATKGAAHTAA